MGDGGPYVAFNPRNRDFWASHTGLAALHDNQLDQAYQRACSFILYAKERLITEHNWVESAVEDRKLLFRLISADKPMTPQSFCLPKTWTSFLDPVALKFWTLQFRFGVFDAQCPAGQDNDLYMSGPIPLSDIFYLFQSVAPGMLVIARVDKSDNTGERECVRALPRQGWVENHHQLLEYVLGSIDAYEALLDASRLEDQSKAFKVSWISRQDQTIAVPAALPTAHAIDNPEIAPYPEGIIRPKPELTAGAANGKFRYDRDFLMQSQEVCKAKPDMLPALPGVSLEPKAQGGLGNTPRNSRSDTPPPPSGPNGRRASGGIGLGITNAPPGIKGRSPPVSFAVGQERFTASQKSCSVSVGDSPPFEKVDSLPPEQGRKASLDVNDRTSHDPVESFEPSQNQTLTYSGSGKAQAQDSDSPEVTEREVRALLNLLTMENFDSISDDIIGWANKSEKEKDGRTLDQVTRLVFEKAKDECAWSEMYARLCRKIMEQISQNVQDDGIRNTDGKPIAGAQLFRKYLLNRCQEDFERGWSVQGASSKVTESEAVDDSAVRDAADEADVAGKVTGEEVLYSQEDAAQKAKRQGLGLVKFIGELFKLQMLTERIMHECIKTLLGNTENPEEEGIESLCTLLSTIGQQLDTAKARHHMDVYFRRMEELTRSSYITSRMQYMLLDVIELREREWVPRTVQAALTTIEAVLEQAAKDQMSRRREYRGAYEAQTGLDEWASFAAAPPGPPTAGDPTIGLGSIFAENGGASLSHSADFGPPKPSLRNILPLHPRVKPVHGDPIFGEESVVPVETSEDEGEFIDLSPSEREALMEFIQVVETDIGSWD